jgi:hypothetical protein
VWLGWGQANPDLHVPSFTPPVLYDNTLGANHPDLKAMCSAQIKDELKNGEIEQGKPRLTLAIADTSWAQLGEYIHVYKY